MSQTTDLDPKDYVGVLALLKKIDFLKGLPEAELKNMLFSLQAESFESGKTILFQGEIANRLFIIRRGAVVISSKIKGKKVHLADLTAPQYFGEISLLRPASANATAVAGTEGADLIILTHDAMTDISQKSPDISRQIQNVIDTRLASKQKIKDQDHETEP